MSRDNVNNTVNNARQNYTADGNYSLSGQDSPATYYGSTNRGQQQQKQQQNALYQDRNVYQQPQQHSQQQQQQSQPQHRDGGRLPASSLPYEQQHAAPSSYHGSYNSVAATDARRHIQQRSYEDYPQQLSPEEQLSPVSPENDVSLPYGIGSASNAQQYHHQQQLQLQQQQQQLQQQQQGERSGSDSSDDVSLAECLAGGGVELINLRPMPLLDENGQVLLDDGDTARMQQQQIQQQQQREEQYCSEQHMYYGGNATAVAASDVYTIPEDEDELSSPTGADGVTSIRKRQMANTLTGQ